MKTLPVGHSLSTLVALGLLATSSVYAAEPPLLAHVRILSQVPGEAPVEVPAPRRFCGEALDAAPEAVLSAEDLSAATAPYIGQAITPELMSSVIRAVVQRIDQNSRYLADVFFPPAANQDIRDGTLALVVRPARLGKVVAKGQEHYKAEEIECRIHVQVGAPLDLIQIATDIGNLNSNASWRRTDFAPRFEPGEQPGTTDVVLNTYDEKLWRVFGNVANTGTRDTGLGRVREGFNIGNVFGLFDHQLGYSHYSAFAHSDFYGDTLDYTMPLANGDRLAARLDYSRVDVGLEDGLFRYTGSNTIVSLERAHNVLSTDRRPDRISQEVYGGVEFKRIGNSLAFNQEPVSNSVPQILQGYAGWRGTWTDSLGVSLVNARLTLSPGNLIDNNDTETFNAAREGARPRYWRLNANFDRNFALSGDFTGWQVVTRTSAQVARKPLISSERFGLSGISAVRGYYQDSLIADAGIVGSIELQTPRMRPDPGSTSDWQFIVFADAGRSWNASEEYMPDLDRTGRVFNLAAVGVGIRVNVGRYANLLLDFARPFVGMNDKPAWFTHAFLQITY